MDLRRRVCCSSVAPSAQLWPAGQLPTPPMKADGGCAAEGMCAGLLAVVRVVGRF